MRKRSIRARLDDLAQTVTVPTALCVLHGDLCRMGANWPLDGPEVELLRLIRDARIRCGAPVEEPDPYTVNEHRPQSKDERAAHKAQTEALLKEARAAVAAEEAEIIAGRD